MATTGDYDSEVQMFVERPREMDLAHLRFLRWLGVRGYLEHGPAGPPDGVYARHDAVLAGTDGTRQGAAPLHHRGADVTGGIKQTVEEQPR